jgi:hypothetical protein
MLILLMLCGFLGLMTDTARLQYARTRAQTAADAAAVAAYLEMRKGNTAGMQPAAQADAARNGLPLASVAIDYPPRIGAYAADTSAVEARITEHSPAMFMRMFGQSSVTVTARAVAIPHPTGGVTLGE